MKALIRLLMLFGVISSLLQTNSPFKLVISFMYYVLPLIVGVLLVYSVIILIEHKKEDI